MMITWDMVAQLRRGYVYKKAAGDVAYFQMPAFLEAGISCHGLSARTGGVSDGCNASLNMSFNREDDTRENIITNHRLLAKAAGIPWESMVMDTFEHGVNVIKVDSSHMGSGYIKESLPFCDGLVTNDPAVTLVTGHADCLPLYLYDPVRNCAGLMHAGWKGVFHNIVHNTVELMKREYNSNPKDMLAGIGPCICADCFEADEELGELFAKEYPHVRCVWPGRPTKAQVDLPLVVVAQYINEGILASNISLMDVCTFEEPNRLYSHRRDRGKTGGMASFLRLPAKDTDAFLHAPQERLGL
ncbi:peptidoglycan editing factor PgeF [Eubacteriales bacterium OttesenSCG-928-K08]|nr:peptidoglycan editing factor PgeF [Eubacteriales bacterium OttesenSCG-928-K08]